MSNDLHAGTRAEIDNTNLNFRNIAMTLMGGFYFLFTFFMHHFFCDKKLYINFWAIHISLPLQIKCLIHQQTFSSIFIKQQLCV